VEGQGDCDGDDGHVGGQAEVGEECALVGGVVAGVRRVIGKEQRPEQRGCPEGRARAYAGDVVVLMMGLERVGVGVRTV